ncbi:MAG TPA: hypothetical protein VFS34_09770 [Thermoanaerobaculia bacterium]|nr:hypothetical protein [Thermoanaerobaculia bacterium]
MDPRGRVLLQEELTALARGDRRGAELLPQTFFIGRDGRIASVAVGFESRDALERRVREILRQRPGA